MNLQAVTVSVNYSDFLVHTLEENHKLFKKWIIITDKKDTATKQLCEKYIHHNVICVQTDVFYDNGAKFNKFAGINEGLKLVDDDAWVLFLDSDIAIHDHLNWILKHIGLEKDCIYGVDRVNCQGLAAWENHKKVRDLVVDNWLLTDGFFKFGARLVHYYGYENGDGQFAGWNPLGFFQLAHRSSFVRYPDNTLGADHCDLLFARLFPRNKRVHIPETLVIHLESEDVHKAVNWYGRVSAPFEIKHAPSNVPVVKPRVSLALQEAAAAYAPNPIPVKKNFFHYLRQVIKVIKRFLKALLKCIGINI